MQNPAPMNRGTQIGDYIVEREVSRNQAEIVLQAVHATLDRVVTIKLMAPARVRLRDADSKLVREANILDGLRHAGIPRIYDCGVLADGRKWYATDVLAKGTLADLIAAGARLEIAHVIHALAAIIEHAHEHGIAHRSLRADHIACATDASGHTLLVDHWGDARPMTSITDAATDVHALGVIAYQALTGMMPFAAPIVSMMLARTSVGALCPRIPRAITALIDRMIAADPLARPTLTEVRLEAARIIAGVETPTRTRNIEIDNEVTRFDIALAG